MLFPSKQSKQTTPPKGSSKFLLRSRTKEKSRVSRSFASLTPSPPKERRSSEEKNKRENHPTSSCSVPLGPTAAAFPSAPLLQCSPRPHYSSVPLGPTAAAFPSAPLLKSFVCFSILFLPTATTDKFTCYAGLRFLNPHRHQQSDDRSPVKAVQTSIFTQRKVLVPTFKRREETQVLGLRGGTNHPQKLRPKVYLLPTPTKNTFFFGFHASEKSNFQQRRERRCQYARFFFFRIC